MQIDFNQQAQINTNMGTEAIKKAVEIDASQASKVVEGLEQQQAAVAQNLGMGINLNIKA
ncbi:MAG: hypothetical protein WCR69_01670 [Sulfuricurvum sp.]|jgi:hypothetical protein